MGSWIMLAQSFLMGAFVTSTGPSSLRYVIAAIGLAMIIVTLPSIIASGRNIELQEKVYFNMVESEDKCQELHGHCKDMELKVEEDMRRKHYGHLLPTMSFRGRGSKSLTTVVMLTAVQFIGWFFLLISLAVS